MTANDGPSTTEIDADRIVIGARRRDDDGDIDELAESIDKHGLLHPLVVDEDGRLVAGHRRLLACRSLGWDRIPVRSLGTLTDAERREIELEENVRRKDLTPVERSKQIVELAEVAAELAKTETRAAVARVSGSRGPRPDPGSRRRIADRIGLPESTIRRAEQHVAAIDAYPELEPLAQGDAVEVAAKLNAMPKDEQGKARVNVTRIDLSRPPRLWGGRTAEVTEIGQRIRDALRESGGGGWPQRRPSPPSTTKQLSANVILGAGLMRETLLAFDPALVGKALRRYGHDEFAREFAREVERWLGRMLEEISPQPERAASDDPLTAPRRATMAAAGAPATPAPLGAP